LIKACFSPITDFPEWGYYTKGSNPLAET